MEKINSYYGIATNDYLYAKAGLTIGEEIGNYNSVASLCSQAAEKFLKAVIEFCFADEELVSYLRTHNLRVLVTKIKERYPDANLDSKDCKWLGDFYFDARYPGDNFVLVSKEDAEECIRITETIKETVKELLREESERRKEAAKKLSDNKITW